MSHYKLHMPLFTTSHHTALTNMFCNLQIEVNGQETFSVSMRVVAFFSGKLRRLFSNPTSESDKQHPYKLLLHDFPGGPEGFELVLKFCYNGGTIDVAPSNVVLLHAAAKFMEINENQTEKCFESINAWSWTELLDCLKQCQDLLSFVNSWRVLDDILDALVERIATPNISSPFANFSDGSSPQFSGEVSTNYSGRSSSYQAFKYWLHDLDFLSVGLFEKVSSAMIFRKLDRRMVCAFLVHYQKVKSVRLSPPDEKCRIVEILISSLCSMDRSSSLGFPFRSLCDMLRVCLSCKMGKFWVRKVEIMIGVRLDEATLDDLLVRSRGRTTTCVYDVGLIMRLLKVFLGQKRNLFFDRRLMGVGVLMDAYLAEVAPDPNLKPSNFLALALCLPDSVRESHDRVFEAIDVYFKVHKFVSKEEKSKICSALNYDKLSSESLANIAKNAAFPASSAAGALFFLQTGGETRSSVVVTKPEMGKNCSSFANEAEEILAHLSKGRERKKLQKKFSRCL